MEYIQGIESWIIAALYLGLMIFCLTQVRKKGMGMIAVGFAFLLTASLGWRILPLVLTYDSYESYRLFYNILKQINIIADIGFGLMFIIGICQLTRSVDMSDNETTQTHQLKDLLAPGRFGSVGLYASTLIIGFLLTAVGVLVMIVMNVSGGYDTDAGLIIMGIMIFIGVVMMTIAWIYFVVVLYRIWKFAIIESHRHNLVPSISTPGKAVGFLFIPLFNLYWIFLAYGRLPADLNAIARAKNVDASMSEGLGTGLAIICLLSVIPFVGYVTGLVTLILGPVFLSSSVSISKRLSIIPDATE